MRSAPPATASAEPERPAGPWRSVNTCEHWRRPAATARAGGRFAGHAARRRCARPDDRPPRRRGSRARARDVGPGVRDRASRRAVRPKDLGRPRASRHSKARSRSRRPPRSPGCSVGSRTGSRPGTPAPGCCSTSGRPGRWRRRSRSGAPADVFASANAQAMEQVQRAGAVEGSPTTFARNTLELVVRPGNPLGIRSLRDLTRVPVVALCATGAPCGASAARALDAAHVTLPVSHVTRGQDVKATLRQVTAGDADAAIVYVTDRARSAIVARRYPSPRRRTSSPTTASRRCPGRRTRRWPARGSPSSKGPSGAPRSATRASCSRAEDEPCPSPHAPSRPPWSVVAVAGSRWRSSRSRCSAC